MSVDVVTLQWPSGDETVVGQIDLRDGKLVGSRPAIQRLIESVGSDWRGTPEELYAAFGEGWSNGYVLTRKPPEPTRPSEPGPAGIRYPAGTVR
jgi:hypothetical protein